MFIKMFEDVKEPVYETKGSAGMDVRFFAHPNGCERVPIRVGECVTLTTGLKVDIPEGYELQVRPRSGLAFKFGITVLNSPGTIDSDFEHEVKICLVNHGMGAYVVQHEDRIAQFVFAKVERPEGVGVRNTERSGGFGSTNRA